jgi:dephospho-CoA kinase
MLRVGLTGGLGSGKSTAAALFAAHGAHVLSSDELGRELMEPDHAVFAAIVEHFGDGVVNTDGRLDRKALARIAFADGRVEELNAIVHPAVIEREVRLAEEIAAKDGSAVVLVESALIFETKHADGWRERFDKVILVRAPEAAKIARFVARASAGRTLNEQERADLEAEARRRLAHQISDDGKAALCDYVLSNDGSPEELVTQVDALWPVLADDAAKIDPGARL